MIHEEMLALRSHYREGGELPDAHSGSLDTEEESCSEPQHSSVKTSRPKTQRAKHPRGHGTNTKGMTVCQEMIIKRTEREEIF